MNEYELAFRRLQALGDARGERVILVPEALGGWYVIVGTTNLGPQAGGDLLSAIEVTANYLGVKT